MNAIIKTEKTLALISNLHLYALYTVERHSPLFRIARKSSCKFSQLLNCIAETMTSCCLKAKGFGSGSSQTSFDRQRKQYEFPLSILD